MGHEIDNLTPLDARQSLLMDNPARREYAEMAKFNFAGPYEPYRDHSPPTSRNSPSPTRSIDRLVDPPSYYEAEEHYARNDSRLSIDSHDSLNKHQPITPSHF